MDTELTTDKTLLPRVDIRYATAGDLPAMEWDGEYSHYRRLYAEAYQQQVLGDARLWVAELEGVGLIAQVFVQLKSARLDLADGVWRAYLYGFRVKPQHRSMGVGTEMMRVVEEVLWELGFRWINLNVAKDNTAARRLYERLGYSIEGSDPGRWSYIDHLGSRRDVNEPAWRMQKALQMPASPGRERE